MFLKLFFLFGTVVTVLTAPPPPPPPSPTAPTNVAPSEKQQPTVIPIISQSEELEPNGTYKFSYETGNGIKREEIAYDKVVPKARGKTADSEEGGKSNDDSDDSDEIHVQQGSYSYVAPDGTVISVKYIADENGFQPIGDHIPKAPTSQSVAGVGEKSIPDSSGAGSAPVIATKSGFKPEPSKENAQVETNEADSSKGATESATTITNENAGKDISTTPAAKEAAVTTEAAPLEALSSTEAATTLKSSGITISSDTKESSSSAEISTKEAASPTTIAPST